jgi:hypothetical protein
MLSDTQSFVTSAEVSGVVTIHMCFDLALQVIYDDLHM